MTDLLNGDSARLAVGRQVAERSLDWITGQEPDLLALLAELVNADSHPDDLRSLRLYASFLKHLFARVGTPVVHERDGRHHLAVDVGEIVPGRFPVVLCHYDTVWPTGTAAERPFSFSDGIAHGPGVLDMKASIAMAYFALEAIRAAGASLPGGARLLLTGDEEDGNPTSRGFIAENAAAACAALVLEPSLPGGRLKTRRKGVLHLLARIEGRAAHAGTDPDAGLSAVLGAAQFALDAAGLADREHGVSVNVGVMRAGERRNVVAEHAELELDVRAFEDVELDRVVAALAGWTGAGFKLTVEEQLRRPPMPRSDTVADLLGVARQVVSPLGLVLDEGESGGGSEGNLVAQLGIPVLDGLGAEGSGAHSLSEQVIVRSLLLRTALLAGLVTTLSGFSALELPALAEADLWAGG